MTLAIHPVRFDFDEIEGFQGYLIEDVLHRSLVRTREIS